ncbi:MAG: indolepyruvate oxidoreductase subunit beta [Acidobacteria bacterium]|nr:indolepyruvate oxidoreductase subunit beta [Acidobacteriota bacterium]
MNPNRRFRLLLVGVGGQGVLSAARMLGEAALAEGKQVVVGQIHGMSQRGGSVESTVLIGPGRSSFIGPGGADALLALEPLEAMRALPRLSRRTRVVVSLGKIPPFTLAQKGQPYPDLDGVLAALRGAARDVITVDGPALAEAAGSARALNMVMLGALASLGVLPVSLEAVEKALQDSGPGGQAGCRAFRLGGKAIAR